MSFQRLHNVSTRYTNAPITARRFSDETDTDSVTSSHSSSVASSDSGSVVSEDGTESGSLLGHDARELRRRHAQARVNNTLQYAHGRINNGVRPVQGLANGVAEGGDSFYRDVARPFFDEVLFKIRVTGTVIVRLLFLLAWYIAEIPARIVWYVLDLARRSFWSALNLIDASIWYVLDLTNASFCFLIDMAHSSFEILPQASIATSNWLRYDVQWWMWKPIAIMLAVFIGFVMTVISILHGFTSMANYLCSDTSISQGWTGFPEICKHSNINTVLSLENTELFKLADPSDTIINSVSGLLESGKEIPPSRNALLTESTALKEFAWTHQQDLESFSHHHNISKIAEAIHGNATIFNTALDNFSHHHRHRVEELELKIRHLLDDAKTFGPHSPFQRCFSESLCYYFPGIFSYSTVARQNYRYLSMATHFLRTPETTTIPQHAVEISQSEYNIAHGFAIAKDALLRYEPFLKLACNTDEIIGVNRSDFARCHQDPSELIERLEAAFGTAQIAAAKVAKVYKMHKATMSGMAALNGNLSRLVAIAVGKTTPARGDVNAAAARAILHRFVVQVKSSEVVLGTRPVTKTLDDGTHKGSRYFIGKDGSRSEHFLHPQWTGI